MERRGSVRFGAFLAAIVVALVVVLLGPAGLDSTTPVARASPRTAPADDVPVAPSDTVSEFFPENANLSDCVGLVQQPGCGSEARGGWRQTVVFAVLFVGLGLVLWRVSRGIKANRVTIDADAEPTTDRT